MKNISALQSGQTALIDANILIYANQCLSKQCVNLLERCADNDILGVVPTHIAAEVMHILMIAEARELGIITGSNPAKQLSENPNKIKTLTRYETLMRDLFAIGLHIVETKKEDFFTAMSLQKKYGLLTNDSLFAAVGIRLRINSLVSADTIFSRIKEFTFYSPDDLK